MQLVQLREITKTGILHPEALSCIQIQMFSPLCVFHQNLGLHIHFVRFCDQHWLSGTGAAVPSAAMLWPTLLWQFFHWLSSLFMQILLGSLKTQSRSRVNSLSEQPHLKLLPLLTNSKQESKVLLSFWHPHWNSVMSFFIAPSMFKEPSITIYSAINNSLCLLTQIKNIKWKSLKCSIFTNGRKYNCPFCSLFCHLPPHWLLAPCQKLQLSVSGASSVSVLPVHTGPRITRYLSGPPAAATI